MARRKKEKRPESISGGYSAIPWAVIDSTAFAGASDKAKSLLFALMRQHSGNNNGHLHLARAWLNGHGWTCDANNKKARDELIERGLIFQTRRGGLNMGADLFALTWFDISNYVGLDISPRTYPRGAYALCNLPATQRRKPPAKKQKDRPNDWGSANPTTGSVSQSTDPTTGHVKPLLDAFADPTTEHNVITPLHTFNYSEVTK